MHRLTYHSDAERLEFIQSKGIDPTQHCCLDMAWFISGPVEWESQGANPVMLWIPQVNEYRINIPRDGHASVLVQYCPWCGRTLPASLSDEWYRTLYALGYADPGGSDDLPPEFETDRWWRQREPT